jgi:alpha-ribazole phosphatase
LVGYHIHLIRCGFTKANEENIYCGVTDLPLSPNGLSELYQKKQTLEYPRVEQVFASPLLRCTETASIIFPKVPIITMSEFSELDLGDFENKTADELVGNSDFKKWLKGEIAPPNGETTTSLTTRCFEGLSKVIREMMNEEYRSVAIISHSGVITNICTSFGVPKYSPQELFVKPGEGIEVLVTAQFWQQSNAFEIIGYSVNEFKGYKD